MELRHLRYFVSVAEAENVSRAALKLHISQPAVSRQIHDLEDEIGLPLLKRSGKSVSLTEAGHLFLAEARAVLDRTNEAIKNVHAIGRSEQTDLDVGYSSWAIDRLFLEILSAYRRAMPKVRVKLHDRSVEQNVEALLEGKLPLAFIIHAPKPGALRGLRFQELNREHIRLAVSPTHPLARRRVISLEDAAREPFVGLIDEEFPDYHFFISSIFASTKNKPRLVERRDSVPGIISGVEAGIGVALAGDRFSYIFGQRIKLLHLTPEPETLPLGIAVRKGRLSPVAEKFWECAKETALARR